MNIPQIPYQVLWRILNYLPNVDLLHFCNIFACSTASRQTSQVLASHLRSPTFHRQRLAFRKGIARVNGNPLVWSQRLAHCREFHPSSSSPSGESVTLPNFSDTLACLRQALEENELSIVNYLLRSLRLESTLDLIGLGLVSEVLGQHNARDELEGLITQAVNSLPLIPPPSSSLACLLYGRGYYYRLFPLEVSTQRSLNPDQLTAGLLNGALRGAARSSPSFFQTLITELAPQYQWEPALAPASDTAGMGGHSEVVDYILERKPDLILKVIEGAIEGGQSTLLERLIQDDSLDDEDFEKIIRAARHHPQPAIFEVLIDSGQLTPEEKVKLIVRLNDPDRLEAFYREDFEEEVPWPLQTAVRLGLTEMVKKLLDLAFRTDQVTEFGLDPEVTLRMAVPDAIEKDRSEILRILLAEFKRQPDWTRNPHPNIPPFIHPGHPFIYISRLLDVLVQARRNKQGTVEIFLDSTGPQKLDFLLSLALRLGDNQLINQVLNQGAQAITTDPLIFIGDARNFILEYYYQHRPGEYEDLRQELDRYSSPQQLHLIG